MTGLRVASPRAPARREHGVVSVSAAQRLAVPGGPARALDAETRGVMEPRFGEDFASVRVHSGEAASRSASRLGAAAYTVGDDVVFGSGRFAPRAGEGRRLLAHELAHVVQQRRAGAPRPSLDGEGPLERAADRAAASFARGGQGRMEVAGAAGPAVMCEPDEEEEEEDEPSQRQKEKARDAVHCSEVAVWLPASAWGRSGPELHFQR